MPKPTTIAIDGPAAAGKSTVGCKLARKLDYLYLDTGVMYRAVTWAALRHGIDFLDETAVTALAQRLKIDILPSTTEDGRQNTILADGHDITWAIRNADIEAGVSAVSAYRGVRKALVAQQRRIAAQGQVVMVGRDIGTIVLPTAELKLFLDAQLKERAMRRHQELVHRGQMTSVDQVLAAMQQRDDIDSRREVSPLQPAADAVIINTSGLTIDQVMKVVEGLLCERNT